MEAVQTATREPLQTDLEALRKASAAWAKMSPADILPLLEASRDRTLAVAKEWVEAACEAKGLKPGVPVRGEEWVSGPWALLAGLNGLIHTLTCVRDGTDPLKGLPTTVRSDGQVVVQVFPAHGWDKLLLSGFSAEVWQQPEVTMNTLRQTMAVRFQGKTDPKVSVVLGAGNIASIPPLDALYKLVAEGEVALVKLNPVNDYLQPYLTEALRPFVDQDFVRFVKGDGRVGAWLVNHELVDTLHITGSVKTHDLIVYGPGEEGEKRRNERNPINPRPITSELGGVGPTLVVPGPWTDADFRFQAEHLVTQKLHNGGFNCIASQVIVVPDGWDGSDRLLAEVRQVLEEIGDQRPSYYPGSDGRRAQFETSYPGGSTIGEKAPFYLFEGLDPAADEMGFQEEAFGPVWSVVRLPESDPEGFLKAAVAFANDKLFGSLGCQLSIHPSTAKTHAKAFDTALADLRYGSIGVNAWSGVGFLLPFASWGAFPGHPLHDAQSGIGVVHNALLFDKPQKTIIRGPFQPFPRTLARGIFHTSPKPLWFVTHKKAERAAELLTQFEGTRAVGLIPPLFAAALSG